MFIEKNFFARLKEKVENIFDGKTKNKKMPVESGDMMWTYGDEKNETIVNISNENNSLSYICFTRNGSSKYLTLYPIDFQHLRCIFRQIEKDLS